MMGLVGSAAMAAAASGGPANTSSTPLGFRIGVCSYSFREFARGFTISMIKELGVRYVSVKSFHIPYTSTPEEIATARKDFEKAGLTIVSGGNMDLKSDDPAVLRKYFEYARACGMPMIVGAPTHQTLPMVEKLAREFNIKVAIHTHGPEDPNFPKPQVVLDAVKHMDPRMGLCMDVGHSMRDGSNVVDDIASAGPRLFDMHMKDLRDPRDKNSWCDVGDGVMPVVAIFKQLRHVGYQGCVDLEYETNSYNPVPGMLHSLGYMNGVVTGIAG